MGSKLDIYFFTQLEICFHIAGHVSHPSAIVVLFSFMHSLASDLQPGDKSIRASNRLATFLRSPRLGPSLEPLILFSFPTGHCIRFAISVLARRRCVSHFPFLRMGKFVWLDIYSPPPKKTWGGPWFLVLVYSSWCLNRGFNVHLKIQPKKFVG